jgi:hypothetical protein
MQLGRIECYKNKKESIEKEEKSRKKKKKR